MLKEHGRWQNDIGNLSRFRHELLMHGNEQVLALEALADQPLFGADIAGLVFWINIAVTGPPPRSASESPVRIRTDLRLIELADIGIGIGRSHQFRLVQPEDIAIVVESAAALILP